MRFRVEIGGVGFLLNPAAISAIRYRAEYGESIVNDLAGCTTRDGLVGHLLRMVHCMIDGDRPELPELAKLARKDKDFLGKAAAARDRLLADDPKRADTGEEREEADEYNILAMMVATHMDMALIYELPVLHLASVAQRYAEGQDNETTHYREATEEEMALLYPR